MNACYVGLPVRRARTIDAPTCQECGRRMRVGSTGPRVAYYYPACKCALAEPVKRLRPVDLVNIPQHLRRVFGLANHEQPNEPKHKRHK